MTIKRLALAALVWLVFVLVLGSRTAHADGGECVEYPDVDMMVGIDHSSSMEGNKIVQASEFASSLFLDLDASHVLGKRGAFYFCKTVPVPLNYLPLNGENDYFPRYTTAWIACQINTDAYLGVCGNQSCLSCNTTWDTQNVNSIACECSEGPCVYYFGDWTWDGTSLYEAIILGASEFDYSTTNTKLLVIITDGYDEDSASWYGVTKENAIDAIHRQDLVTELIFVGVGSTELAAIASAAAPYAHYHHAEADSLAAVEQEIEADICLNHRPTARINVSDADKQIKLGSESNEVMFNGEGSRDAESAAADLQFHWMVMAPNGAQFDPYWGATTMQKLIMDFDDEELGLWHVDLTVTDPRGASDSAQARVNVLAVAKPTVSVDGGDTVDVGGSILLHAAANDPDHVGDPPGGIVSYVWRVVEAPPGASFPPGYTWNDCDVAFTTTQEDITMVGGQESTPWIFQCTVTDNEGESVDSEPVEWHVRNLPPQIVLQKPLEKVPVGGLIYADAEGSLDPDGGELSYAWDIRQGRITGTLPVGKGMGGAGVALHMDTTAEDAGTWVFQLRVADNEGETVSSEPFSVLVDALPEPVIDGPGAAANAWLDFTLDGSASIDPDSPCTDPLDKYCGHETDDGSFPTVSGGINHYLWSLIGVPLDVSDQFATGRVDEVLGLSAKGPVLTVPAGALDAGDWTFQLDVWDAERNQNENPATHIVTVAEPNGPPFAILNPPAHYTVGMQGTIGQDVVLSGQESYDLDNVLEGEALEPGLGLTNYQWTITPPPKCPLWQGASPSGPDRHTVTLFDSREVVPAQCQGVWHGELEVTDDDSPPHTNRGETWVAIGNCPDPLCIDFPTAEDPEAVTTLAGADVLILYHLDSAIYSDPALTQGMVTKLEIFRADDLSIPIYTALDPNVSAVEGGQLAFHWNGYWSSTQSQTGLYTVRLTLLNEMLGETQFVVTEPRAICIEAVELLGDQCLDAVALAWGIDQIDLSYKVAGGSLPDEMIWRVRDASGNVVHEDAVAQTSPGVIHWNGLVDGAVIAPGRYTAEIEVRLGASRVSASHEFLVFDSPPYEVTVEGLLGDVIQADVSTEGLVSYRFEASATFSSTTYPAGHQFPANDSGYVAQVDNWQNTLWNLGTFYYVPTATGHSTLQLVADDSATAQLTCMRVSLKVEGGFSTNEGRNPVTFGTNRLSIYRQQQRLRYLNYPIETRPQCQTVTVDGVMNYHTMWAIGVFNSSINGNGRLVPTPHFDHQELAFINASNAPRWVELQTTPGVTFEPTQEERWATSWVSDVLAAAGRASQGNGGTPMRMTAASRCNGSGHGNCNTLCHAGGVLLDIDTPSANTPFRDANGEVQYGDILVYGRVGPFYRTQMISGIEYIAAKSCPPPPAPCNGPADDPNGDRHIVACTGLVCEARPLSPLPAGAKVHNADNYNDRELLPRIVTLIVDNPDCRDPGYGHEASERAYDLDDVLIHLGAFGAFARQAAVPNGITVSTIFYNDPRTHNRIPGLVVGYSSGHGGHFHVQFNLPTRVPPVQP